VLLEQLLSMPGTQSAQLDGIVARVRGLAAWQHSLQVPPRFFLAGTASSHVLTSHKVDTVRLCTDHTRLSHPCLQLRNTHRTCRQLLVCS